VSKEISTWYIMIPIRGTQTKFHTAESIVMPFAGLIKYGLGKTFCPRIRIVNINRIIAIIL